MSHNGDRDSSRSLSAGIQDTFETLIPKPKKSFCWHTEVFLLAYRSLSAGIQDTFETLIPKPKPLSPILTMSKLMTYSGDRDNASSLSAEISKMNCHAQTPNPILTTSQVLTHSCDRDSASSLCAEIQNTF